jgi:hypothetical protein
MRSVQRPRLERTRNLVLGCRYLSRIHGWIARLMDLPVSSKKIKFPSGSDRRFLIAPDERRSRGSAASRQ